MFLNHFSLSAHPFAENPPITWLLHDPRIEQALARLKFFYEQSTIALILGQTGIGKSSLLRLFYKRASSKSLPSGLSSFYPAKCQRLFKADRHQSAGKNPKWEKTASCSRS